jgi:hypothetical protein
LKASHDWIHLPVVDKHNPRERFGDELDSHLNFSTARKLGARSCLQVVAGIGHIWSSGFLSSASPRRRALTPKDAESDHSVTFGRVVLRRRALMGDHNQELSIFILDDWRGEPNNQAPEEHDEIQWVGIEELAYFDLASSLYRELLRRALA